MQRIAICLSGQPRSIEFSKKSIIDHFKNTHQVQYDFFCHSWDYNTWKLKHVYRSPKELLNHEWLENQLQSFNPKDLLIQSEDDYNKICDGKYLNYGSLFFSMFQANLLKIKYELANNFRYDIVAKIRYDQIFEPFSTQFWDKIDNRLIYFSYIARMNSEYDRVNTSDCTFFGDSWGMDIASDFFFKTLQAGTPRQDDFICAGPGTSLSKYLSDMNVSYARATKLTEIFYRREVLGKDVVVDFEEIENMHISFYHG